MDKRDQITLFTLTHISLRLLLMSQHVDLRTAKVDLTHSNSFPFPFPIAIAIPIAIPIPIPLLLHSRALALPLLFPSSLPWLAFCWTGDQTTCLYSCPSSRTTRREDGNVGWVWAAPPAQQQHALWLAESVTASHLSFSRTQPMFLANIKSPNWLVLKKESDLRTSSSFC